MEPVAKARPRMNICNGMVHSYTPDKTREAQEFVNATLSEYTGAKFAPHIPVKFTAVFYRTKSKWARKREKLPVRKPDIDNFLKLLLDGCNKVLVADDAQITTVNVKKRWSKRQYGYITLKLEEDEL